MTSIAEPTPAPPHRLIGISLIAVAAIETLSALANFSVIFVDYHHETALLKFAQALTSVNLALAPLLAGAALVFAVMGRLRHAIVALAALSLLAWAVDLPSIAIHGMELSGDLGGVIVAAKLLGAPLIAAAAIVMAAQNERLALATLLVSLPTILAWAGIVAFAIGVSIFGF